MKNVLTPQNSCDNIQLGCRGKIKTTSKKEVRNMTVQEKEMFEETVKNLAMLDRDSALMVNAATTALLMKQTAEEMAKKDIPAA